MSDCNKDIKDLYYYIFTILINGKLPLQDVITQVSSELKCYSNSPYYKNMTTRVKYLYKHQFGTSEVGIINKDNIVRTLYKIYDQGASKEELYNDFKKVFFGLKDSDINVLVEEIFNLLNSYVSSLKQNINDVIYENISLESPNQNFMSLSRQEIMEYMKRNNIPITGKNMTKEELHAYLRKMTAPRSPRNPKLKLPSDEEMADPDICTSRKYKIEEIKEYIRAKGWPLKKTQYRKEELCRIIRENLQKQQPRVSEERKYPSPPPSPRAPTLSPPPSPRPTPTRIQIPRLRIGKLAKDVEEFEDEEEEEITKCGAYDEYSNTNDFFVCKEDEVCDVDKQKCISEDSPVDESYRAKTLEKDGMRRRFLGTKQKLKSLDSKYKSLSKEEEEKLQKRKEKELKEQLKLRKKAEKERKRQEEEEKQQELQRQLEEEREALKKQQEKIARDLAKEQERLQREVEKERKRREKERKKLDQEREEQERLQKEAEKERKRREKEEREEQERREREVEKERNRREKEREEQERLKKEVEQQKKKPSFLEGLKGSRLRTGEIKQATISSMKDIDIFSLSREKTDLEEKLQAISPDAFKKQERKVEEEEIESEVEELEEEESKELEEEQKLEEEVELADEQVEEEEEEEREEESSVAIDFEELQKTLRNILKQPSKVSATKDLLTIPKKISYCVGLRV